MRPTLIAAALVLGVLVTLWWLRAPDPRAEAGQPPKEAAVPPPPHASNPEPPPPRAERRRVRVVATYRHDRGAFTQGLLWHGGALYESTGQYGHSELRQVDLATGEVKQRAALPAPYFGEGLARVGQRLIQLTWREETAFTWNLATFEPLAERDYPGEGWGLCFDGRRLVMSDGSDTLRFLDPETLAEQGRVRVSFDGGPLRNLNELECVEGTVWANVWTTELLVQIDPETGRVLTVVDASGLLTPRERVGTDVLNGIAWRPETGTFLITGKYWPKLFEVELGSKPNP